MLATWYYIVKKKYRLPVILLSVIGIIMNKFMKETPFWIPMFGTPLNDIKNNIFYISPFIWVCINSIFLYVAVDCLWTVWRHLYIHLKLKGFSLYKVYTFIFIFSVAISVTLVFTMLIISLILSFVVGNSAYFRSEIHDFVTMLILWIFGTSFLFWMTFIISLVVKNVYLGLLSSFTLIITSGYAFPNYLFLPGIQWIYGAHIMQGGPSFMESTIYLAILLMTEFLIGYKIISNSYRDFF